MYKDVLSNSSSISLHPAMSPSRPCSGSNSNLHPSPRKVVTVAEAGVTSTSASPLRHHAKKKNHFPRAKLWTWANNSEVDEQMEAIMKDSGGVAVPVPLHHQNSIATNANVIKPNTIQKKKQNKFIQGNDLKNQSKNVNSNNNPSHKEWRSFKFVHRSTRSISRCGQRSMIANLAKEHESLGGIHSKENIENSTTLATTTAVTEALQQQQLQQQSAEESALALAELSSRENTSIPLCHVEQVTESQSSIIFSHPNEEEKKEEQEEEERIQSPATTLSTKREFWQIYKASSTSKRPDSARSRYISNCEENSLLVLPILDLKPESPHKSIRYDMKTSTLRYDDYYLGDKRAEALGDAMQFLPIQVKHLSMQNIGITGTGSSAIIEGISMGQLTDLSFSQNKIGMKGTIKLFTSLQDTRVNLKCLDLSNNQLGDQCIKVLIQCLLNRCTLEYLNLSRNNIYHSAKSIGELLRITTPLKEFNLSWNHIRGEPAFYLVHCMVENLTLTNLDLSNNTLGNNGKADIELGKCLENNKSLKYLNLSNNQIQGKAILVFVDSLKKNSSLEKFLLCGNPIGSLGGETILRAIASNRIQKCQIDLSHCLLEIQTNQLYLPLYCGGGKYTLHLNDQADFIFLKELLISFFKKKAIIQEAFHNGHPSTFYLKFSNNNNNNNINKDEKALIQAIPTSGKYEIKIFPCYNRQFDEHVSQKGFEKLVDLMERSFGKKKKTNTNTFHTKNDDDIEKKKKKNNENDDAKLFCIKILTEEFVFTLDQANILLSLFCKHTTNQLEKASAAAFLIPQILPETTMNNNILTQMNTMNTSIKKISYSLLFTKEEKEKEEIYDCFSLNPIVFFEDKDFDGKIDVCGDICALIGLTQLNEIEQTHVEKKLKGWISFNRKNPTGKYHLNLSNPIDRKILLRLFEANSCDCKFRTQYKLINVSCNNENEIKPNCFRNVKLNHGTCNLLDHFFQIPHSGILEFDFVLTKRPYACCTPLNEQAFEKFLKEFKELKVSNELKIIGLRAISSRFFFTCTQMQQLMEHFDDHTMMTTSTISTISTTMTKTKTKTKTNEFHGMNDINARGQVFMILFGRIIDENHLNEPWSILDAWTQKQIKEKIGVLNLFHPLQNLTKHELNLQKKDQRLLASILIKLSSTNEAELINVTYNEKNCEQYYWKTWINPEEDLLPHMGIFACTCRMILPIESENQLPTNSYRKRLLHTLNHKIESKEKDLSL